MAPSEIVSGMQSGHPEASEALYAVLSNSPNKYMTARLGRTDNEDRVHELYLTISRAILEHRIAQPAALYGFIWTVTRWQAGHSIEQLIRNRAIVSLPKSLSDGIPDAEAGLLAGERAKQINRFMGALKPRSREILHRFYIREQSKETIIQEMGLTDNLFRLLKSRALCRLRMLTHAAERN